MSSANNRRRDSGGDDGGGGANWMDTYGDLVTLLLTFFVLLFAMSEIDATKFRMLAGSFSGQSVVAFSPLSPQMAFENPVQDPSDGLATMSAARDADVASQDSQASSSEDENDRDNPGRLENTMMQLYHHMLAFIETEDIAAKVVLIDEDYMVRLIIEDMIFFRTAEANLLPEARPILDKVIEMFNDASDLYTMLSIEGHTDNRPINTARFPSNWVLSSHRALSVGAYVMAAGMLDEDRLQVVGYGERHPIAPNDSAENMARNRRVEFVAETKTQPHRGRQPMTEDMETLLNETGD